VGGLHQDAGAARSGEHHIGRSRGEKVADGTVDAWCELDGARLDADVALGVEVEHD